MKKYISILLILTASLVSCRHESTKVQYPQEVEELLDKMTLEEKVGQMTMICLSETTEGRDKNLILDEEALAGFISQYHVGAFLSATGSHREWKDFIQNAQTVNLNNSRLQIPAIFGIDHIHGANYVNEGTIFPHNLMLANSFDTSLIAKIARATVRETAGLGLLWNFSPVLDLGKNPLWPRLYETFGEDPFLCSSMGRSYVSSYQNYNTPSGHRSATCLKHFIGYSDPRSGHDRSPAEIPGQIMYEMHLPAFRESIKAGAHSIMVNSAEVNGEPLHISERYLKDMLRSELGFEGVILTDIKDILKLVEMHKAVPTVEEAVILSLNAGIDMSMSCNDVEFAKILVEKVNDGTIPESRIDESVRRILSMKFELGLFDNPYPDDRVFDDDKVLNKHRDLAFEAAVKSQVLLKNEGILPLNRNSNILLTGFAANSKRNLNGAWTFEWLGAEEERQPEDMNTIRDVMQNEWKGELLYLDPEASMFKQHFLQESRNADYILLTIGEEPYSEFKGDINDLRMPADCRKLCELAFSTGKPVILLLVQGRPRLLEDIHKYAGAVVFTGYPGLKGAEAIAALLSGEQNFSGKLAFSYPEDMSNFSPYNSKITRDYEPLYEFGHGLTYTNFQYSDLVLNDSLFQAGEPVKASLSLTNTGEIRGDEIVLFFVQDMHGKITRPKKELLGIKRVNLEPGETKNITFSLDLRKDLSYPNAEGEYILEKGHFRVLCGDEEACFQVK